jgi:hypothetical protein
MRPEGEPAADSGQRDALRVCSCCRNALMREAGVPRTRGTF